MRAVAGLVFGLALITTTQPARAHSSSAVGCDVTPAQMEAPASHGGIPTSQGIAVNVPNTVVPGQAITVTLSGSGTYEGLLLIAEEQGQRVGSFTVPLGFLLMPGCPGSPAGTLSHSSSAAKALPATFTWTAPATMSSVTFRGIVARGLMQYEFLTAVTATATSPVPSLTRPVLGALLLALVAVGIASQKRKRSAKGN
jgi:hypothetical protein